MAGTTENPKEVVDIQIRYSHWANYVDHGPCTPIDPMSFIDSNSDHLLHIAARPGDTRTIALLPGGGQKVGEAGDMGPPLCTTSMPEGMTRRWSCCSRTGQRRLSLMALADYLTSVVEAHRTRSRTPGQITKARFRTEAVAAGTDRHGPWRSSLGKLEHGSNSNPGIVGSRSVLWRLHRVRHRRRAIRPSGDSDQQYRQWRKFSGIGLMVGRE